MHNPVSYTHLDVYKRQIVDSVLYRDTPMIHATILFLAFFLVICNAVSDILQRIFQRGHAEGAVQ